VQCGAEVAMGTVSLGFAYTTEDLAAFPLAQRLLLQPWALFATNLEIKNGLGEVGANPLARSNIIK